MSHSNVSSIGEQIARLEESTRQDTIEKQNEEISSLHKKLREAEKKISKLQREAAESEKLLKRSKDQTAKAKDELKEKRKTSSSMQKTISELKKESLSYKAERDDARRRLDIIRNLDIQADAGAVEWFNDDWAIHATSVPGKLLIKNIPHDYSYTAFKGPSGISFSDIQVPPSEVTKEIVRLLSLPNE